MKKRISKLVLRSETLLNLTPGSLSQVQGNGGWLTLVGECTRTDAACFDSRGNTNCQYCDSITQGEFCAY